MTIQVKLVVIVFAVAKTTPEAIKAGIEEYKKVLGGAEPKPSNLLVRTVKACAIMVGTDESQLHSGGM